MAVAVTHNAVGTSQTSNIFTEAYAISSNYNLRNATKKVALPLTKRDFLKTVEVTMEPRYGMIYQRSSEVVRLSLI